MFLVCLLKSALELRSNSELYHIQFYMDYLKNRSLLILFENMFFGSLLFFSLFYSMIIFKTDYLVTKGEKPIFSQIVARGLYFLIFLTILYFAAAEFFIPSFENKLDSLKNNTVRAKNLLDGANDYYEKGLYYQSLKNYEEYATIIEDSEVKVRIRELKVKIADALLKKEKNIEVYEDTTIAEGIVSYTELAEIFYQKQDYLSSLFYLLQVKSAYEKDLKKYSSEINRIDEKIENIKQVLRFKNTFMVEKEFNKFLDKSLQDIQYIYSMKKAAEIYVSEKEFQKALFTYNDILKINPSLRDAAIDKNKAYLDLVKSGADVTAVESSKIFSGKNNMVFMLKNNLMIDIDFITKALDMEKLENFFYMYDVKLYSFDDEFNIKSIIYIPFAQSKSLTTFTTYCYDLQDRNVEYFPIPLLIDKKYFEDILSKIDDDKKSVLTTFYEVKENCYKNEKKLANDEKIKIGKIIKEAGINILSIADTENKKTSDYILNFPIDINVIYNFSYNYKKAINFSLYKLFQLRDFNFKNIEESSFSIGFNNNFLKTAIADKISRLFLFFALGLVFITISWRLRADYLGNFPVQYIPMSILTVCFMYFISNIIQVYSTFFYSVLAFSLPLSSMLIISFLISFIITVFSIIFIASNRV